MCLVDTYIYISIKYMNIIYIYSDSTCVYIYICCHVYKCVPEISVKLSEVYKVSPALSLSLSVHEPFCRKPIQELKHKA